MENEAKKDEIISRYQTGENVASIAGHFGVNRKTIHKWLHAWGIPARNPKCAHTGRKRRDFTSEEQLWIVQQFTEEGRLLRAIAEELQVWEGCVRRVLVDHGVRVKIHNPTQDQVSDMVRLYQEGASLDSFQETLGISRSGAKRILQNAGVEIRKRGKVVVYRIKDGQKQCGKCKRYKNLEEFQNHKNTQDGLQVSCRTCTAMMSGWAKLKRVHGITPETRDKMIQDQGGVCKICKQPETRERLGQLCSLVLDHCHRTGKIRGFLCHSCNTALGHVKDDPVRIQAMLEYIQQHTEKP